VQKVEMLDSPKGRKPETIIRAAIAELMYNVSGFCPDLIPYAVFVDERIGIADLTRAVESQLDRMGKKWQLDAVRSPRGRSPGQ